jgi:hypothetical protein
VILCTDLKCPGSLLYFGICCRMSNITGSDVRNNFFGKPMSNFPPGVPWRLFLVYMPLPVLGMPLANTG